MAIVKIGVRAFNIPASELSILVCAMLKKNVGKKVPRNPDTMMGSKAAFGVFLYAPLIRGKKQTPAKKMRIEAT